MAWIAQSIGLAIGAAIITIGLMYVSRPTVVAGSFGLPLPDGLNVEAWLRLKGVRDIVSGTTLLTFVALGEPRWVGVLLLSFAVIPVGDMIVILANKGSVRTALGVHALTAIFMAAAGIILTYGARA